MFHIYRNIYLAYEASREAGMIFNIFGSWLKNLSKNMKTKCGKLFLFLITVRRPIHTRNEK